MGDKYISMKCSGCGANLNVASDREVFFCEFCGQKHFLRDENHHKYTYRKVDDARIREADVKEAIRLEELKLERLKLEHSIRQSKITMKMKFIPVTMYFAAVVALAVMIMALKDSDTQITIMFIELVLIIVGGLVSSKAIKK